MGALTAVTSATGAIDGVWGSGVTPGIDEPEAIDPAETLVPLVRDATVRVHGAKPGHPLYGSGFFVAPNWVLTCAHVACRGSEDAENAENTEGAAGVGEPAAREVTVGWGDRMLGGVVEWAEPAEHDGAPLARPRPRADPAAGPGRPPLRLADRAHRQGLHHQPGRLLRLDTPGGDELEPYNGRCTISGQAGTSAASSSSATRTRCRTASPAARWWTWCAARSSA